MRLDELRYFHETAQRQHLGQAARALSVSPSAVSHGIARLEEELGVALFRKRGRQLALTDGGARLLEEVKQILERVDRIAGGTFQPTRGGRLRVAATHALCSRWVAPELAQLRAEGAFNTVEALSLRSADVIARVAAGEIDVGVCFSPLPHPEAAERVLRNGQLVVAVRSQHPCLRRKTTFQKTLEQYPAVLPKAFAGIASCERHPAFAGLGVKVDIACLIDSYDVALEAVRSSDVWTLVPDVFMNDSVNGLKTLTAPDNWDAPYRIVALWPCNRVLGTAAAALVDRVADRLSTPSES